MSPIAVGLVLISTLFHAAWNLLAHRHSKDSSLFLRMQLVIGAVGIGPILILHFMNERLPLTVCLLAAFSGLFLALYYLGLMMSYRNGEFGLVYPVARAVPVLLLAVMDMMRGSYPSGRGWTGLILVVSGCLLIPQASLRQIRLGRYVNRTLAWVLLSAAGTCGYTTIDKLASERLSQPSPTAAAQYCALQFLLTVPYMWLALHVLRQSPDLRVRDGQWAWPATAAALTFAAYWMVLCAYQHSRFTSYVVALRQFSIVLGVAGAAFLFGERVGKTRLFSVALLVAGVILISLSR